MLLVLPDPSVTVGPTWASMLNTALELVDVHDHTSDAGVPVPTAGLNINDNLQFNSNAALGLTFIELKTGATDPVYPGAVYVKSGNLYFTSTNLTAVQLTDGTSIKGVAGNISGLGDGGSTAAFNDFTEDFTFKFNTGNKHAAMNIGEIRVYPFDGVNAYDDPITIKSPLALATAYSLTLPLELPVADGILSTTSAGVIKQGAGDGSAAVPSIGFASDTNTGLYRIGADNIGIAVGGVKRVDVSENCLQIIPSSTSTTVPAIAPGSSAVTGIKSVSNTLYLVADSTDVINLTSTTINLNTAVNAGSNSITTTGAAAVGSINTDSGGAIKFKLLTYTSVAGISSGGNYTATIAHGLTASSIRAISAYVYGNMTVGVGGFFGSDGSHPYASTETIVTGTSADVAVTNGGPGTLDSGYKIYLLVTYV